MNENNNVSYTLVYRMKHYHFMLSNKTRTRQKSYSLLMIFQTHLRKTILRIWHDLQQKCKYSPYTTLPPHSHTHHWHIPWDSRFKHKNWLILGESKIKTYARHHLHWKQTCHKLFTLLQTFYRHKTVSLVSFVWSVMGSHKDVYRVWQLQATMSSSRFALCFSPVQYKRVFFMTDFFQ